MATIFFSQHSSNPLERRSSDARPNMFHDLLNKPIEASSDPLSGYDVDQEKYVKHISTVRPSVKYGAGPVATKNSLCVDLDEPMDQSDDLIIVGKTPEPQRVRKVPVVISRPDEHLRFSEDVTGEVVDVDEVMEQEEGDEEREHDEMGEEADDEDDSDMSSDSDDEENSLWRKPPEEQQEITAEIRDLEQTLGPILTDDYKLLDRLGTGTFSSVYKAIDLHYHTKWDNTPWHGHHPPSSTAYYQSEPRPRGSKVFVAVKRIYVTSSPERIRNEIAILEECRSCRHVSQLITAFRERDQVVVIMPYQRNDDFREYFNTLSMAGIKSYFRCLFRALRDIHSRNIIHRDVKPANFLFDPRTGIGTLCDFGLACRIENSGSQHDTCLHSPSSEEHPHGKIKDRREYDAEHCRKMSKDAKQKSALPSEKVGYLEKDPRPVSKANRAGTRGFRAPEVLLKCGDQTGAIDVWSAGVILLFFLTRKFPLFQSNDDVEAIMEIAAVIGKRKMERAAMLHNRTFSTNVPSITPDGISWREFIEKQNPDLTTPPEPNSRYYPYSKQLEAYQKHRLENIDFEAEEDGDGETDQGSTLSSPPSLLGLQSRRPRSSSTAGTSSIHFPTSPPKTVSSPEPDFASTTPERRKIRKGVLPSTNFVYKLRAPSQKSHNRDLSNALDLVELLMHHESTARITPRKALYHPFLHNRKRGQRRGSGGGGSDMEDVDQDGEDSWNTEDPWRGDDDESEPSDDEFFPHPFGRGVCKRYHFEDEVDAPCVRVYTEDGEGEDEKEPGGEPRMEVVRLSSGEGIAIGRQPCEFHKIGYELDMM
ncbi:kinase-like protein [Marasmius fiardii PR-910]|nr:kinase-like protein [Marasmius fiardii PR-910]